MTGSRMISCDMGQTQYSLELPSKPSAAGSAALLLVAASSGGASAFASPALLRLTVPDATRSSEALHALSTGKE
jgi:hypothetical protein